MKKAGSSLKKDYIREISKTKARFLSILALVALGVFVLVGLSVSGPIIRKSLEAFIDDSNTYDISLSISESFEEKDMALLNQLEGVSEKEYIRTIELLGQDDSLLFQVKSLPQKMVLPQIIKGSLPQKEGDILLDSSLMEEGYSLGQTIDFQVEEDKYKPDAEPRLKTYSYKVVGFVRSIDFLDEVNKGQARNGGEVDSFAYIRPQAFKDQSYQEYLVKFVDLEKEKTWTKDYQEKVQVHRDRIEDLLKNRPEERFQETLAEFKADILEGRKEIEGAKIDLEEGREELERAQADLAQARKDLEEARALLEGGLISGREKLTRAQNQLSQGRAELLKKQVSLNEGQARLEEAKEGLESQVQEFKAQEEGFLAGLNNYNVGFLAIQDKSRELLEQRIQIEEALLKLEEQGKISQTNPYPLPYSREEISQAHRRIAQAREEIKIEKYELVKDQKTLQEAKEKEVSLGAGLSQEVKESEERDQSIRVKIQALEDKLSEKKAQMASLETNPSLEEEEGPREDELASLRIQVQDLQGQIKELEASLSNFSDQERAQAKAWKDQADIVASLESTLRKRQTRISSQEETIKREEGKILAQEKAMALSQAHLKEAQTKQAQAQADLEAKRQELLAQRAQIDQAQRDLMAREEAMMVEKTGLDLGQEKINLAKERLNQGQAQLAAKEKELLEGRLLLEAGKRDLEKGQSDLEQGRDNLAREEKLGRKKIAKGREEIQDGQAQYQEGREEYDRLYPQALEDIAKGQEDLDKAEGILSILEKPSYILTPRSESTMIYTVFDYGTRLDNLSMIFPPFFFAVAMLLCSTTMNRMVEEERISIGTYKALGYTNKDIWGKYVFYGGLAALLGGIPGALGGNYYLSYLITKAYTTGYALPGLILDFYPLQNFLALGIGILATGLVAYLSVSSSLHQNAASLMRPRAPKGGSRIFLERIGPLWSRLGFFQKVTARNLFRYKKRMAMTLVGILGCVALLVLGFGIQSSVDGLVDKQFKQLTRYDLIVLHQKKLDQDAYRSYRSYLDSRGLVDSYLDGRLERAEVDYSKGLDQNLTIIIPSQKEDISELITLRDRASQRPIELKERGVVLTEKLADLLDKEVGQNLDFEVDGNTFSLPIEDITEGYAGHYLYMTRGLYEKAFDQEFEENMTLLNIGGAEALIDEVNEDLSENQAVLSVINLTGVQHLMGQLTSSIGQIVLIIILASSLLAIVVLFTLTNINIQERKRELSTIKVLGFFPRELTAYIYRETGVLTLMGILLGSLVGKLLHYNVMRMVVPDQAMLDPELTWINYAIPALITIAISLLVGTIVHWALKKINMVEALKAVE